MTTTRAQARTDLLYSDVEDALRSSVADLLAKRSGPAAVLAALDDRQYDMDLWRTLVEQLDVAGLLIPESLGGVGGSAREVAVIAEELGRAVAPVPFLGSAVLATSALLASDTTAEPVVSLLRQLAAGEITASLAVPLSAMPGVPPTVTVADGRLTGTVTSVVDAAVADVLLVPTADGLHAVRGASVSPVTALDRTRGIADVTLDGAEGDLLPGAGQVDAALVAGAGILASEQLGVAQWCLDTTVKYVKERYQFGRPVGSFQALKHRLADVWLELVTARAAARYAADTLASSGVDDDGADVDVAVSLAQAHCSLVAVHAAEEAI
ncbi:MAG TPA: acyl-CoA dehydrogenase family protein, partial [Pseudonocardiaceae bacterium]|nr:acyl-CoA dehydrogenase family protein [Pseudonocardiaceae bacterium]